MASPRHSHVMRTEVASGAGDMATRLRKSVGGTAVTDTLPRESRVPAMARLSTDLRTLCVNAFLLLAVVTLVPVIAAQFTRTQVLIEPIAVPAALAARGLDGTAAANHLWDGIYQAMNAAATSKSGISAIPAAERVDFSIPDSGVSIDALIYYIRQFFHGYETRISGDLSCADDACAGRHHPEAAHSARPPERHTAAGARHRKRKRLLQGRRRRRPAGGGAAAP